MDTLSGEAAYRIGLVDQLAEEPLAEALVLAERLAAVPAGQAASVKEYFALEALGRWATPWPTGCSPARG